MTAIEILTADLQAAGLPVIGVAVLSPGQIEESHWFVFDAADGSRVRVDFSGEPTAQQLSQAAAIVLAWDPRPRRARTLFAIRADLNVLSGAQKAAVWADLSSGSPPKWALDAGPNAAAIAAIEWAATVPAGVTASERTEARLRLAAMYCQDNPRYLVSPSFDPSIDVPGDEPVG